MTSQHFPCSPAQLEHKGRSNWGITYATADPISAKIFTITHSVFFPLQGAQIVRVHDVKETVEAMRVVEATLSAKENKRYE